MAFELIRWPLKTVLQYEWLMTRVSYICCAISSKLQENLILQYFIRKNYIIEGGSIFFAICIFGGNAYRRDWLMYPKFNVLSWSYSLAVIAFIILTLAALVLRKEAHRSYELRSEAKNLVMQMEMQEPNFQPSRSHSRSLGGGYI